MNSDSPKAADFPHIPDHELVRCIGKGAYGEVWLARNIMGAWRAVKIVQRQSFEDERPFEREFNGIQKFEPISRSHDSQVDILHVGRNADYFYYVMELADDQQLGQQINPETYQPKTLKSEASGRGALPVDECVTLGLQLTTALSHLHGEGLVHRDIKPSNIVFINGVPKLADIGLVTSTDATISFVGTQGFYPPEGPGTPQGDIYSLGKVLYELLTGRDRQDFPELPTSLANHPERERLLELNAIVAVACAPKPSGRYKSALAMKEELTLLHKGKSVRQFRVDIIDAKRFAMVVNALLVMVALGIGVSVIFEHLPLRGRNPELYNSNPFQGIKLPPNVPAWAKPSRLIPGWGTLVDPDGDCEVSADAVAIKISIPPNVHELAATRLRWNAPRILNEVEGDFSVQVAVSDFARVDGTGTVNQRSAGLLVWQDPFNYILLNIRKPPLAEPFPPFVACDFWINGNNMLSELASTKSMRRDLIRPFSLLRMDRHDDTFVAFGSNNGRDWTQIREFKVALKPKLQVGLTAGHDSMTRLTVVFRDLIIKSGRSLSRTIRAEKTASLER